MPTRNLDHIKRYELEYSLGLLTMVEPVDSITKAKGRFRKVLEKTDVREAQITGFDKRGDAQVIVHWYGIYGGWGAHVYP